MNLSDTFTDFDRRDWDEAPDGQVRLAVVGLGGYARNVSIPAIESADYATLGAVVSGDAEKRETVAADHDATALSYAAYEDGVDAAAYDGVYVATPNRLHLDHIEAAADHGKAVVSEKPLEATTERARAAVEACQDAGVTLMTAYRMQTDPAMRRLREFVQAGGIGEPVKLFGDFTFPVLAGSKGPDQWRLDGGLAGGGAMMDVGVYPLNTARFLLGQDPVAVQAGASATAPFGDGTGDADSPRFVDEHVHFRTEFPDCVGQFSASFSGFANTELAVVGTEGRLRVESAFEPATTREVTVSRDEGEVTVNLAGDETVEEFDYFAHCVLTGTDPEPDGRDGLTDMRVMDAVYESAESGERVVVDGT